MASRRSVAEIVAEMRRKGTGIGGVKLEDLRILAKHSRSGLRRSIVQAELAERERSGKQSQ